VCRLSSPSHGGTATTTVRPLIRPCPGVSNEKPVENVSVNSTTRAPNALAGRTDQTMPVPETHFVNYSTVRTRRSARGVHGSHRSRRRRVFGPNVASQASARISRDCDDVVLTFFLKLCRGVKYAARCRTKPLQVKKA
jgi:hypothetical protein